MTSHAQTYVTGTSRIEATWRRNPMCCECGLAIATPEDAGLVTYATGDIPDRLAHIRPAACFAKAVLRINHTFNTSLARARAGA